MDSGNSGSIQSSSTGGGGGGGGDGQEFESCSGETMSALFNSASMASFENMSASQLYCHNNGSSFSAHHQQHQVSNYTFDPPAFSQTSPGCNFMINQNCDSNNSNTFDSSKSNGADSNNNLGMVWLNKYGATTPSTTVTYSTPHRPRLSPLSIPSGLAVPSSANNSPQSTDHQGGGGGGRNPKKRSRAARGAPTMVLTTDTNNFRQMVQEFTGIPPPPFGAAPTAFLGRARFDLFGGVSSVGMQHPPYIRKPFPQKIAPQNFMATINDPTAAIKSHLQMPSSSTAPENFLRGDRDPATSQQPKATESLMNKFGLGHDISNTIAKADSTTSTSVGHGNMMTSNLDNERIPYQHQTIVDKGPPSKYNGGVTMGEAMVDSWICSSD